LKELRKMTRRKRRRWKMKRKNRNQ